MSNPQLQRLLQAVSQLSTGPAPMESDDHKIPETDTYTDYVVHGDLSELSSTTKQTLKLLAQEFDVHAHPQP